MGGSIKIYLNLIISITSITLLSKYLVQTEQINETVAVTASTSTTTNTNLTCPNGYCNVDLDGSQSIVDDDDSTNSANWISKYAPGREEQQHPVMNDGYLRQSSIIFGLTKTATYDTLNSLCYKQMKEIERAILRKDVWAMKVLDASAHKESGFLWGHNFWLGSPRGCEAVQQPVRITLSDMFERTMKKGLLDSLAPFDLEYRVVYLNHNSPWQVEIKFQTERIVHIGLCLPKSCTSPEIYNMTQSFFDNDQSEDTRMLSLHPEVIRVKDMKVSETFFNKLSLKLVVGVLTFTFLMFAAAAVITPLVKGDSATVSTSTSPPDQPNGISKFIKCFDLSDNWKFLFATKENQPNSIPVINGLRSISCLWILLFHVMWYMYFTVDNKTFLISYAEKIVFQYISTAPLLVDIFFTISGFLLTYNFLMNSKKMEEIQNNSFSSNAKVYLKMVVHRYLRLAPLYLVMIGMVEVFTSYADDVSLFHLEDRNDQICQKYWWRNFLFIQNLFEQKDLCLNWTWSLACEMQFFLITTGLLFLYTKNQTKAKLLFVAGLCGTIIWQVIIGFRLHYQLSYDVMFATGTQIYISPFMRVMPYFLGSATGWYLANNKKTSPSPTDASSLSSSSPSNLTDVVSPLMEKCLWNLAILIFFGCIYSTIHRAMSTLATICLFVGGRLAFSVAVSWMIIGSATGRSVWWSRILEHRIFQHVNKLSYAIYLLNPFIINIVFSLNKQSTHADPFILSIISSGFVLVTYVFSILFYLAFEIPYSNFSIMLLKRKKKVL